MGQGILILLGLLLAYALVCGAVTALVSVWSGNGVAAMAASVGVMVGAMVLAGLAKERGGNSIVPEHDTHQKGGTCAIWYRCRCMLLPIRSHGGRILERLEESQKNGGGSFQMAKPVVQ